MDLPLYLTQTPLVVRAARTAAWSRRIPSAKVRSSGTLLVVASASQGSSGDAFLLRIICAKAWASSQAEVT